MKEKARGMLNEALGVRVMLQHGRVFAVVIFFLKCVFVCVCVCVLHRECSINLPWDVQCIPVLIYKGTLVFGVLQHTRLQHSLHTSAEWERNVETLTSSEQRRRVCAVGASRGAVIHIGCVVVICNFTDCGRRYTCVLWRLRHLHHHHPNSGTAIEVNAGTSSSGH